MARCVCCHQNDQKYKFKEIPNQGFCDCNVHIAKNRILEIKIKKSEDFTKELKQNISNIAEEIFKESNNNITVEKISSILEKRLLNDKIIKTKNIKLINL